ncbi:MAG: hypothetical protein HY892_21100 [Deltaproteobacteria bacterium]|nr:hypothetical protein [Deltaproteobacteria bacterium]
MKSIIAMILAVFSLAGGALGQSDKLTMDCREAFQNEDAAVLRQAPFGAKRIMKHRLRVSWAGGSRDFIDKPPYDAELDGTSYSYCGYKRTLGLHLIHKSMDGVFTGVLLDNNTGQTRAAGQYVSFSNDQKKYFASVQPDGLDGEKWYVYGKSGTLIWKGLSGISGRHPQYQYEYFVAELVNPRWNSAGELEANYVCSDDRNSPTKQRNKVTLKLVGKKWAWLPRVFCPEIPGP